MYSLVFGLRKRPFIAKSGVILSEAIRHGRVRLWRFSFVVAMISVHNDCQTIQHE